MACKHEINLLMGTADGIVCRGCGRLFKDMAEIIKDIQPEEEAPAPAPKKKAPARKKKEDAANA